MKRRNALAAICAVLAGCGGGGGDTDQSAPVASSPEPVATAPALPANIAAWGDSLTAGYSPALANLYPERVVYNGGVGGQTSSQILARIVADTAGRNGWINVFWMGRNIMEGAQARADIAAAVADLAPGNDRFVVLSVINGAYANEIRGGSGYTAITQTNASLAALYAGHYLDVRSHLVASHDPANPQDVIDFSNDTVPSSLRTDLLHLNERGNQMVAQHVRDFIAAKGW